MIGKKKIIFLLFILLFMYFPLYIQVLYSFIEYIDSIEYIVYLINTQRCRVPLYSLLYRLFQIRALLILNGFLRPKQHIFHTLCIISMTSRSLIQINTGPNPEHQMIKKIYSKKWLYISPVEKYICSIVYAFV